MMGVSDVFGHADDINRGLPRVPPIYVINGHAYKSDCTFHKLHQHHTMSSPNKVIYKQYMVLVNLNQKEVGWCTWILRSFTNVSTVRRVEKR